MITQRQRWVPGSPKMRCFNPSIEERENRFLGPSEVSFLSPPIGHFALGVLGACLRAPTHRQALAVENFGLGLVAERAISGMGLGRRGAMGGYRVAVRRRGSLVGRRNEAWTGIMKADTSDFFPIREARR